VTPPIATPPAPTAPGHANSGISALRR
jgi:hypothetical protein